MTFEKSEDLQYRAMKLALMEQASKDPLFLSDIREIQNDFIFADYEIF